MGCLMFDLFETIVKTTNKIVAFGARPWGGG